MNSSRNLGVCRFVLLFFLGFNFQKQVQRLFEPRIQLDFATQTVQATIERGQSTDNLLTTEVGVGSCAFVNNSMNQGIGVAGDNKGDGLGISVTDKLLIAARRHSLQFKPPQSNSKTVGSMNHADALGNARRTAAAGTFVFTDKSTHNQTITFLLGQHFNNLQPIKFTLIIQSIVRIN